MRFRDLIVEEVTDNSEYKELLDTVTSVLTTLDSGDMIYVAQNGDDYKVVELNGEDYILSNYNVSTGEKKLIKSNKIYKDGDITDVQVAISRLNELVDAATNKQVVTPKSDS